MLFFSHRQQPSARRVHPSVDAVVVAEGAMAEGDSGGAGDAEVAGGAAGAGDKGP